MGDVIGVIDAEDDVAKDLLVHAEALFEQTARMWSRAASS